MKISFGLLESAMKYTSITAVQEVVSLNAMKLIFKWLPLLVMMQSSFLFDFNDKVTLDDWRVVNDGVMGGLSQGKFTVNEEGHGFFHGNVSLENYGGFSSVRYAFEIRDTSKFSEVIIRLKGDGKPYQLRVKSNMNQRYSYIADITTSGAWEIIRLQFSDMYPAFRGRLLDLPKYSGKEMSEIAFLIGNKKKETFALEIDYIKLQ